MNIKLVCGVAAMAAMGLVACGDDTGGSGGGGGAGGGAGGGTTSSTTTSSTSSNGGGGEGGGAAKTCAEACAEVYACGSANNAELCPGWAGGSPTEAEFVGDSSSGCIQGCEATPILINLVNPDNCAGTITTLKGANGDFAASCEGAGGAGGGA